MAALSRPRTALPAVAEPWQAGGVALSEAQRGQLAEEPADHAGDAQQPDRLAGQADDEPGIEARRLAALGPHALAHRGRGRAQACRDGQQDCLLH